jgi:phosphoenolpyruvate carboxykinase (ATP)
MPLLPEELTAPPGCPAGVLADLRALGIAHPGRVHANLVPARLTEAALERREAVLTAAGALAAYTGSRTGRSPRDRYIVREPVSDSQIAWGKVNQPIDPARFDRLYDLTAAYLQNRELFVQDGYAGADPAHRLSVRVVAEHAWHAQFARCLFLRPTAAELPGFRPDWTILHAAGLHAAPARDGTRSEVFVVLHFARRLVLAAGTHYAGEIKKAVFSVLNYLLPQRGVFPMHCSANVGTAGDVALFFGLSGTGKTTLSADPNRRLIGDDEHGWSDQGVFNIEGGCYAKTIGLSREREPQIYDAIRFGCVLENVPVDPLTRDPDYASERFTENTRAAYPVDFIPNCELSGRGGHPSNIFFLTCDAFGVLPPLAKLTPEQAMYHFLSGYTAKAAGTEVGVTDPEATFSTCFAEPFLPLPPARYAELLRETMDRHRATVWLLNTGWTGGPFGVGRRMSLPQTRALLQAALTGKLASVPFTPDPVFGVLVPKECPGVPAEVLRPRQAWADPAAYDAQAHKLAGLFRANFRQYEGEAPEAVRAAGPKG